MDLHVVPLAIPDVKLITPTKHNDARGFFSETYSKKTLAQSGIALDFVQDSQSLSQQRGTVRGLHYQGPPFEQHKLIRAVRGRILDIAVDIRRGSPTFGRWVSAELSADNWTQMLIPVGFAHGICTLEPDTEIMYKVTNFYSPEHDFGIRWDDPDLNITWPFSSNQLILSDKDKRQPLLKEAKPLF